MRRLVLLRHAKTQASHMSGDTARELLPRGLQDAQQVGLQLRELGLQLALVSPATRTRQTFAALNLAIDVEYHEDLYYQGSDALLQRIAETDDGVTGLLVVGHAPTIPGLSAQLSSASSPEQAESLQTWFPTASFAEFSLDASWSALANEDFESLKLQRIQRRS